MIINQKIKLVLNKEQEKILDSQSLMCNKMHNILLEKCIKDKSENYINDYLSNKNLRNEVVNIKKEYPYFYSVHSSPLKNVALRLKQTYKNFFNGNGYPKYRSNKNNWYSLFYDEPNKGIKVNGKDIKISLGYKIDNNNKKIRLYVSAKLKEKVRKGEIRNYRIIKELDSYYLIVCLNKEYKVKERITNRIISLDPNHKNFFVGIDNKGKTYELANLSMIKYFDKKIDELKSKRDKLKNNVIELTNEYGITYKRHSIKYYRYNKALKRLYINKSSQIKTALFTIANKLCDNYDVILIGDYVPKGDKTNLRSINKKVINESYIGKFRQILSFVANKRGVKFKIVNEKNTTLECFACGSYEVKAPNVRTYFCPCCGKDYYRDINSAINIGRKLNLLSSSDYIDLDLTKPMYKLNYNLYKTGFDLIQN